MKGRTLSCLFAVVFVCFIDIAQQSAISTRSQSHEHSKEDSGHRNSDTRFLSQIYWPTRIRLRSQLIKKSFEHEFPNINENRQSIHGAGIASYKNNDYLSRVHILHMNLLNSLYPILDRVIRRSSSTLMDREFPFSGMMFASRSVSRRQPVKAWPWMPRRPTNGNWFIRSRFQRNNHLPERQNYPLESLPGKDSSHNKFIREADFSSKPKQRNMFESSPFENSVGESNNHGVPKEYGKFTDFKNDHPGFASFDDVTKETRRPDPEDIGNFFRAETDNGHFGTDEVRFIVAHLSWECILHLSHICGLRYR